MHRIGTLAAAALLLATLPGCAGREPDSAFLGEWSMSTETGGGRMDATMTISRGEAGELTGNWTSRGRTMELYGVAVEADQIRFDREIPGGTVVHFEGRLAGDQIEGSLTGPFGTLTSSGTRAGGLGAVDDAVPDRHDREIRTENGRTLLWARDVEGGETEWFDMTDSAIDPHKLQFGIGKDTISSIDAPEFARYGDPVLAERDITLETPVLGVDIEGEARAYPVDVMSIHEVVNDEFGDKPYAVLW